MHHQDSLHGRSRVAPRSADVLERAAVILLLVCLIIAGFALPYV
jgi:hypothetical protein